MSNLDIYTDSVNVMKHLSVQVRNSSCNKTYTCSILCFPSRELVLVPMRRLIMLLRSLFYQ